jgi:cytochrome c553
MQFIQRPLRTAYVFSIFFLTAACALAQTSPLQERLKKAMADPAAAATAKKVTFFCDVCHGADGNSVRSDTPNLAGQHPTYLLTEIDKFARGARRFKFMEGTMKLLTEDDRINATIYYATKPVKPAGSKGSSIGQALYAQRCIGCHDAKGRGTETTPRVAGQQLAYLTQSMTRYRDRTGERIYEPMVGSLSGLKDSEIEALTEYMASLK